jgi:hypothetical protein
MTIRTKSIAIAIVDTENHVLASQALVHSCNLFPPDQIIIFSDDESKWNGLEVHKIPKIEKIDDYNRIITKELAIKLRCDFVLVIQYDGFIINPSEFSNIFLHYDYIGAPWPHFKEFNVGNGGFSLRSRKLVELVAKLPYPDLSYPEDLYICRTLRSELEMSGARFAPSELAKHFSVENPAVPWDTFGFHGVFHLPQVYRSSMRFLMENISRRLLIQRESLFKSAVASIDASYLRYFESYATEQLGSRPDTQ